ncbi:MAG: hypothetical protein PUD25_02205 [Bacilli bacterium]|nr:hypothetical protein [Bacilli bacterium]
MKKCLVCNSEIEEDDNFCPKCGHWTTKGYSYLTRIEDKKILNGEVENQRNRLASLFLIMSIFAGLVILMTVYRGKDILKPFVYIKRQINNQQYGYSTTILKTDNQYFNENIFTESEAKEKIISDFSKQKWQCKNQIELSKIEEELQEKYSIFSVDFCDLSQEEAKKIGNVIDEIYHLFPEISGYLTNISMTNALNKTEYVAYFQPIYSFVNSGNRQVNKTQILLNSYYFFNQNILKKGISKDWYVKDATYESLIAHEFGHYITFVSLLKENQIHNIFFETKENQQEIDKIIQKINDQTYAKMIIETSLANYNSLYQESIHIEDFAKSISNYAGKKNINGEVIYDEIIAEAIHDYFLHQNNANKGSLEVVKLINSKLGKQE